jgi:O-antigen/teichoic acid export membrane protein
MRNYINRAIGYATTRTAKDTYFLFVGNGVSSFFAFIYTIMIARILTVSDFGVFSAATNLVNVIIVLTNLGLVAGMINFVASKRDSKTTNKVIKATLIMRVFLLLVISAAMIIFASPISKELLATNKEEITYLVVFMSFGAIIWNFVPTVLQAKKKFLNSAVTSVVVNISRPTFILILLLFVGQVTLTLVLGTFALSVLLPSYLMGAVFIGWGFLKSKPKRQLYLDIIRFSGWVGVYQVVIAIAGRLDVQMLASYLGAEATGLYSIPQRLGIFIVMLGTSYQNVLAPRFASVTNTKASQEYVKKALLFTIPMVAGVLLWIAFARPFILILFGKKFEPSIKIFRLLALAMIPYIVSIPAISKIIYSIKRPVFIGLFSFVYLLVIFITNIVLIPKMGVYSPTIGMATANTLLAIFCWGVIYKRRER